MRYWWVNQGKTAQQEISGGYLWSPYCEANGARSQFYDNMRIAAPGDIVLSFFKGAIRYIGQIQDFASPIKKPDSFGVAGENWKDEGWMLPVEWKLLDTIVRPKEHITKLAALLPEKYSPIHPKTGNGNQKAYFAEVGQAVCELLTGINDATGEATPKSRAVIEPVLTRIDDVIEEEITKDTSLESTIKRQTILARHGQGIFRNRIFDFEKRCRLTNIENPGLLIASHIKPWRMCSTAYERLDGANGLLLTPNADRLFDRGLISFEDNGDVLVSPRLDYQDLECLGLSQACEKGSKPFHSDQKPYLAFHRAKVFLA